MTNVELEKLIKEQGEAIAQQGMALDLCFARIDALENPATAAEPAADAEPAAEAYKFKVGDKVRVTAGDWGNSQGVIVEIDDQAEPIAELLINGWQQAFLSAELLELVEAA